MKLWPMTIILHVLCGPPGSIRAEAVYEVAGGGNITVQCHFNFDGNKKIFCKNDCDKEEDILVKTSENGGCKGRYCIEYKYHGLFNSDIMNVNITNVTSTDSGRYQCFVERYFRNGTHDFRIEVTKNTSLNPTFTLKPEPNVTLKPTADLRTLQRGDAASVTTTQPSLTPIPPSSSGTTLLFVGLTLTVLVILVVSALSIFCWNKKSKEPPVSVDHEQILEAHRVYEEIQYNSAFRPMEMSTVYASPSVSKPTEDQTSDIYSLATAPRDQLQAEDPLDKLIYSEVDFHNSNNLTVNSAPRSQTGTVRYSAVQVQTEDSHYSTVSLPQQ